MSEGTSNQVDIVIVGSGMGGATVASALAPSGLRIVILEQGHRLQDTPSARDDVAIFRDGVFRPDETWETPEGEAFNPGNYYNVGGNTKFYGATLLRFRAEDFSPIAHQGGTTPGWPISYDDLEPWYQAAETLYEVRGPSQPEDPTEPPHSGTYPHPAVPDEPSIVDLRARLARVGCHPASQPLGVDPDRWLARAATPWDAFPDTTGAKADAESIGLAQALRHNAVSIETGAQVQRLTADDTGRVTAVDYTQNGRSHRLSARVVILSAGAVNSAALLLKSANDNHPNGLANSSNQVGRNFMNHNCSAVLALHPLRRNTAVYQKTMLINDFYLGGGPNDAPLGNVQMLGKISGTILAAASPLPRPVANWIARRSFDFYAMSEDLPDPDSRVTLRGDQIVLNWTRSNWQSHLDLVAKLKSVLRRAGFPIILAKPFDRRTPSHQCGTTRMGDDPAASVVDIYCRSHDHPNLFIIDAGFLPTSAAVNPALTIAAQALRSAAHIRETELAA